MYPLQISRNVVEQFQNAHPRGVGWVRQNLYIRDETVPFFFAKDQKLWNKYKNLVKYLDEVLTRQDFYGIPKIDPGIIMDQSTRLKDFWRFYQRFDGEICTDDLDFLALG